MKLQHKKSTSKPGVVALGTVLAVGIIGVGSYAAINVTHSPSKPSGAVDQAKPAATNNSEVSSLPQAPARMEIKKIGVDASIKPLGLTSDGAMDAPKTDDYIGWYNRSAKMGTSAMSVLLDGHYGTASNPAVFFRLSELTKGDAIVLHGEDGLKQTYLVTEIEQLPLEKVDMKRALYPTAKGVETLTIITCDGKYDAHRNTYNDRTVLYATLDQ